VLTLSELGKKKENEILDLIYGSYKECADNQPEWLEDCDISLGLSRELIYEYIGSMIFVVAKDSDEKRTLDSYVHIIPEWDEEHALFIRCENNNFKVFDLMGCDD